MYGGTHKFGRGGGGGGHRVGGTHNKRNSYPPPPQRPSSTSNHRNKLPSRNNINNTTTTNNNNNKTSSTSNSTSIQQSSATNSSPLQSEESFRLIPGDPPAFAAIIRLAPDLVDEIKRAESLNVAPQIKFHSNPNNTSGNVIDVGGKEFRFTWSDDMGGLCDIYEERQNGEDGNGLLVESGCSWRKLNVQRVLDESTKKHVKKRSEEYEQKLKSRKAIVLDQCNPSMKSQTQALAAVEASPWKLKPKNKKYMEASQAVRHPKPVKSSTGVSSASSAKGRHSISPLPSPHKTSAFARGNATESQTIAEGPTTIHAKAKENAVSSENETPAQVPGRMLDVSLQRENQRAGISDVRNMLVTVLKENTKGMSIKALEKAVGEMISYSGVKFEPILKKIATYEPPGRYILKPGVYVETSKKSYADSGSPDDDNPKHFVPKDNHGEIPALDIDIAGEFPADGLEEHVQKLDEEIDIVDKYDASQHFSDLFGDDEPPNRSEGQTAKTNGSESGSDSDSGSSDSGSDSASRSRSPAGSGSASSSDSEDTSSNSKEASDVDVNIMSDDDKEPNKLQGSEHGLSATTIPWSMPEYMPLQDGVTGDQDGDVSEDIDIDIDIENDFLDDNEGRLAMAPQSISITAEKLRNISPDHDLNQQCDKMDVVNEKEDAEDEHQHKHPTFVKSGGKSKRGLNMMQFEHDDNDAKRFKTSAAQLSNARHTGLASPLKFSTDVANEDNRESRNLQISNELNRDDSANALLGAQKGYNYNVSGKSAAESLQSDRKSHSYNIEAADKVVKNTPNSVNLPNVGADSKFPESNAFTEGFSKHEDKGYRDVQDEEDSSVRKVNGRMKESSLDQKRSYTEAHLKKHGERGKKSDSLVTSRLQTRPSLINGVKADFDSPAERRRLQRESSDLELGELREPLSEEPEGTKKKFERGGSFKQSDTKFGSLGSRNVELKSKPVTKPTLESVNTSSPIAREAPNNTDSSSRRRSPEPDAEDSSQLHRVLPDELQQSRSGPTGAKSLSNKAVDRSKLGHNEAFAADQGTNVEGYGETQKKSHVKSLHEDSRKESSSRKGRGSKSRKSNILKENSDRRKDVSHGQGHNNKRKRRESSDENNSYSKYEKEEPELKGPIKSFSQYKEYVQEYREKYESYCSLNKILESYRNEFQKMGMDLDNAKGKDTERYFGILAQLRDSYRRCGMRHKRLKKIFLVLHEELKQLKKMIKDFAVEYIKE